MVFLHILLLLIPHLSLSFVASDIETTSQYCNLFLSSHLHSSPEFLPNRRISERYIRMREPSSLKREFLKKWTMGLQACNSSKEMSIMERKKAIKLSADVAMASARNGSAGWSRAIIVNASRNNTNKVLIKCITGSESYRPTKACHGSVMHCKRIIRRSKKMFMRRRSGHNICKSVKKSKSSSQANCIAKRLVKKRTELLKSLVPGGESMDQCSLIAETLDYIISLRAQVDVMRHLANASMLLSSK